LSNLTEDEMKDVAAYYGQFKITVIPPK